MAVATKVKQHLHERQLSMHTVGKTKKKGLIELRAESIERNILKLRTKPESEEQTHKTEVISAYQKKGDPVEEIFHEPKKNATQNQSIHPKVALRISAEILHKHYAKIFGHEMQISQAKENHPELFCLHQRVKDTYRQKLKRSKMKGMTDKRIDQIIPKNLERLLNLSKKITANRNLNDEIRLGKVIHYHLLRDLKDQQKPSEALEDQHWNDHKDKIEQSEFWSSEKQIEIKQAEAFIRVWRGAIAFIARNLRHLSTFDDDGVSNAHKDILLEREIKNAICTFDNKKFDGKMRTLFGSEISKELLDDEDHNKALFRFMLKTVSGLRNGVFHFKDISYLKNGLEQKGAWTPDEKQENSHQESLKDRFHKIWCDHQNQRKQRIIDELEAVKISNFIASDGITKIVDLLQRDEGGSLPLPKFKRVVEHAKNLGAGFRFSEIINRHNMEENEALRCQYVITKQLYERPFRHYLDGMSKEELTPYITASTERASGDARKINGEQEIIISKTQKIISEKTFDNLGAFLDYLTAQTASEMRVQTGYESNSEQARKQAEHIDKLKCEVIARAFARWLNTRNLQWITKKDLKSRYPAKGQETLESLRSGIERKTFSPEHKWQPGLYICLYLLPVHLANALRQQLQKWLILSKKADNQNHDKKWVKDINQVFDLYITMHDAIHSGGTEPILTSEQVKKLFANPDDFEIVFPQDASLDDHSLPIRGLREMTRFGGLNVLSYIFEDNKISHEQVEEWQEQKKGGIKDKQKKRESLHDELSGNKSSKKGPSKEEKIAEYKQVLDEVVTFRHLSAQVTLTNHLHLYHVLMAVWGRLIDYAGLWERDCYFIALARMYRSGKTPQSILGKKAFGYFSKGQVIRALSLFFSNKTNQEDLPILIRQEVCDPIYQNFEDVKDIRNNFAHFNDFQEDARLCLTRQLNDARKMMRYDRKLINAVSKSVKEWLDRDGIEVEWGMGDDHNLTVTSITSKTIKHFGRGNLKENLRGEDFVKMVEQLFDN